MSVLRVAVLGYGYWGPNLVRNFYKMTECKIVAVADANPGRLETAKRGYPDLEVTQDGAGLLARNDIDAVVIATPPGTHYALASKALEHGKHVLIEKPLATNAKDAAALVDLAKKNGLTLMVDHTFIYSGALRKIRELIDIGELGDIWYVDSVRVNLGIFQHDVDVVWDLGPHDFSILDYLIDAEPRSVTATGISPASYTDENLVGIAYVTVHYDNDVLAHLHLSWLSPVKIRRMLIGASKKMIVYDHLDPDHQIKVYDKGVDIETEGERRRLLGERRAGDLNAPKIDQTEPLEWLCSHFVECVHTGETPLTGGISGLRVVKLAEAATLSMEQGGTRISL